MDRHKLIAVALLVASIPLVAQNYGTISGGGSSGGTLLRSLQIPIGGYNNATAGAYPAFGTTGTGITGVAWSNLLLSLGFSNSGTPTALWVLRVPAEWDSGSATGFLLTVIDKNSVGSGTNVKYLLTSQCFATASLLSAIVPPFSNTADTGTVTMQFNKTVEATITPVPMTGCSANSFMAFSLARDNTVSSNAAGVVPLAAITMTYSSR